MFYKTEDIYFTLLMDCMEAHMVMFLQEFYATITG